METYMNELEELRIKLATANKVIYQCEEALKNIIECPKLTDERTFGWNESQFKYYKAAASEIMVKMAESVLPTIQSLKLKGKEGGLWWCNSHQREAFHVENGRRSCDPKLGGILLPCSVVFAPITIEQD